jgi:uncharacterized membrane protein
MALASIDGIQFLLRWVHFLSGITWIGVLYYFNFIQGSWFKETEAEHKKAALQKLVPRALWWFRWGAMFTFLSGVLMILLEGHKAGGLILAFEDNSWGAFILTGATLGTLMWANVWFIIWPAQKVVIAVAQGGTNPDAAALGAKAGLASRTNTLFSIPMLYFMGAARHLQADVSLNTALLGALGAVIGVLWINGIAGKTGPMTSVKGVITSGLVLTVVLYGMIEVLG